MADDAKRAGLSLFLSAKMASPRLSRTVKLLFATFVPKKKEKQKKKKTYLWRKATNNKHHEPHHCQ